MAQRLLKIGVSACIMHADPSRNIFNGKPLLYAEQSMLHYILRGGALPFLIPTRPADTGAAQLPTTPVPTVEDMLREMDGLIMVGGVDMSPASYDEQPLKPQWSGDPIRDAYEMELVRKAMEMDKPVLGICRGHQVINVTLGGSLYQDITHQVPGTLVHRDAKIYDQNFHEVGLEHGSDLARIYAGVKSRRINSVHHQAVKDLGKHLVVEATSTTDGVIEALRYVPPGGKKGPYVRGVQWHPEFMVGSDDALMSPWPLIQDFFKAISERN